MALLWATVAALTVSGWVWAAWLRAELLRRRAVVARACHEVRGPLTAAGLALHSAGRPGAATSVLAAVEVELRRAAVAVEDLVEGLARRAVPAHPEPIDLADLVRSQLPVWQAVGAAHRTEVRVRDGLGALPATGDRIRLAQALGNIVANAVEHGGASVELRTRATPDAVVVEVCDDGPGLPAPVAALAGRQAGARGHGLQVACGVAEAHGGRVFAAPSPRGARVVLELPRAGSPAAAQGREA
jgi:signal transduction histidine kinase